ncbi:MAG: hypothetical protein ACJ789_17115 [Thermomicrobiales bacterium]
MRPISRLVSLCAVFGLLLATTLGIAAPHRAAAQGLTADLAILRITGPHQAKPGKVITFKIVATNLGPATSQLDVAVTSSGGLQLDFLQCDLGVSADGPFCEYSNVAPGERRTTLAVAVVLSGAGSTGTLTACTNSEGQTEDPNPGNDCSTLTIAIAGD